MSDFPASALVQGQIQSRLSWRALQAMPEKPAWWQDYLSIKDQFPHFKNWRIWVYIAWVSQPQGTRQPATIEELAPQVLGCTSRAVRNWYRLDFGDLPGVAEAIAWAQAAPLLRSRRAYFETLEYMAQQRDHRHFNYLKLALEMTGDYRPTGGERGADEAERMGKWIDELREAA